MINLNSETTFLRYGVSMHKQRTSYSRLYLSTVFLRLLSIAHYEELYVRITKAKQIRSYNYNLPL